VRTCKKWTYFSGRNLILKLTKQNTIKITSLWDVTPDSLMFQRNVMPPSSGYGNDFPDYMASHNRRK
jgi:hypothetical protein